MRQIGLAAVLAALFYTSALASEPAYWENGTFLNPVPDPGGFALVDTGERYGEWRVVGQAGNVSWISGSYQHDGFQFPGPDGVDSTWVNLAAISRTATGIVHAPVPTTVGAAYTLTFSVGNLVDSSGYYGSSSTVKVYENSTLLETVTNSDGAGNSRETWKSFSITFNADAPFTSIAFINGDGPNDMNCGVGDTDFEPVGSGDATSRVAVSVAKGARP